MQVEEWERESVRPVAEAVREHERVFSANAGAAVATKAGEV